MKNPPKRFVKEHKTQLVFLHKVTQTTLLQDTSALYTATIFKEIAATCRQEAGGEQEDQPVPQRLGECHCGTDGS